ncbi:MAG: beta-lactamase family protein [Deltaproteobacteria bacterium]|nr:beta-lactamase family protein [Deltaproteobacteria bacterium]
MKVVTPLKREHPVVPEIHQALRRGVDEEVFPGGVAAVFLEGKSVHLSATGDAQVIPERVAMNADALFDLASLTKVVATTAATATLVGRRQLKLDDPVVRYWPEFGRGGKQQVTVRHLLAHSSGLCAWKPFFVEAMADPGCGPLFRDPPPEFRSRIAACRRGRAMLWGAVCAEKLVHPPGEQAVYSDLGFIALGHLLELVAGIPLDRLVSQEIHSELRLASLGYRPLDGPARKAPLLVATGVRRPREPAPGQEKVLPAPDPSRPPSVHLGEVDDDNAFAMGGVSGHAGLFGNAHDVAAFGNVFLEELGGASRLAPPEVWATFAATDSTPRSTRALGFDTPSGPHPAAGHHLSASRTLGHTGFTGTSLWIDLRRKLSIALLTNRVHSSRANVRISAFRPAFHDAVVEALDLATRPPSPPSTANGASHGA